MPIQYLQYVGLYFRDHTKVTRTYIYTTRRGYSLLGASVHEPSKKLHIKKEQSKALLRIPSLGSQLRVRPSVLSLGLWYRRLALRVGVDPRRVVVGAAVRWLGAS